MSDSEGGGFDLMNPLHLLAVIVILFIIWLATGNRNSEGTKDKFVKPTDSLQINTYDKRYAPDAQEKQFYKGYFE